MPKYFTREEAEKLLPVIDRLIREALHFKAEYQEPDTLLRETAREIMMRGGMNMDRGRLLEARQQRDAAAPRLQAALEAIQEQGCQVKDLDIGLVDFPTLYRGEEVCLCWRLGEDRIAFWHGPDEGFRGRKLIDTEFLSNHKGSE